MLQTKTIYFEELLSQLPTQTELFNKDYCKKKKGLKTLIYKLAELDNSVLKESEKL